MIGANTQGRELDMQRILVVDDDPAVTSVLRRGLSYEGFAVDTAASGSEGLASARDKSPDLIILDIMMPKKNGVEVCEVLRVLPAFKSTLILFLTALSDEATQIRGLETGADDYISKPISPKVFLSKVSSLFRRINKNEAKVIATNGLIIDPEKFMVQYNGKDISLAKKEFELLYLLASRPGRVFVRNEILSQIWGAEVIVGDRTIDVHIRKIRQKLGIDCITTVKGVGYKFEL